MNDQEFLGYHSEWNLGSPGGWDYQRITQHIGKAVWEKMSRHMAIDFKLDFDSIDTLLMASAKGTAVVI